jgi:hypothetical protein
VLKSTSRRRLTRACSRTPAKSGEIMHVIFRNATFTPNRKKYICTAGAGGKISLTFLRLCHSMHDFYNSVTRSIRYVLMLQKKTRTLHQEGETIPPGQLLYRKTCFVKKRLVHCNSCFFSLNPPRLLIGYIASNFRHLRHIPRGQNRNACPYDLHVPSSLVRR